MGDDVKNFAYLAPSSANKKARKSSASLVHTQEGFLGLHLIAELGVLFVTAIALRLILVEGPPEGRYFATAGLTTSIYGVFICLKTPNQITDAAPLGLGQRLIYWYFACISTVFAGFLLKVNAEYSRLWALSFGLSGIGVIGLLTVVAQSRFRALVKDRVIATRAMIYGGSARTANLIAAIKLEAPCLQIVGVVDERASRFDPTGTWCYRGQSCAALTQHVKAMGAQVLLIDLPWSAQARIADIKAAFEGLNIDVLLAPDKGAFVEYGYQPIAFGNTTALSLTGRPMRSLGLRAKSLCDRGAAALALLALLPLFAVLAAAIKLDSPGPVFFKQRRLGLNNEEFHLLKFRSMHAAQSDLEAAKLTTRHDSRVTRVGHWIRRFSLDELPQLLNILKGDMSFVGPRPHALSAKAGERLYGDVVQRYAARHRVLPGLTGLAQVRGFRGATLEESDIVKRVESDLEYIRTRSFSLDIEILVRTILVVLSQKNAF